jgi:DNA repair protein RadC
MTEAIVQIASSLGIAVQDHIIVGRAGRRRRCVGDNSLRD